MALRAELNYDIVSPYSLIAWEILKRYEQPWNLSIELKPVFLGAVMQGSGNQPPMRVAARAKWMSEDLKRTCKYTEIDLTMPSQFPVNTLHAIRFLRVLAEERPELLRPATEAFWKTMFGPGEGDVSDPSTFGKILKELGIEDNKLTSLMIAMGSDVNKARVREDAAKLVKEGAFGFPWIRWTDAKGRSITTFGSDRFENVAHYFNKKWTGPLPGSAKL